MTRTCKYCGEKVNTRMEGATYRDGTVAHEECHDVEEFKRENAVELIETQEPYLCVNLPLKGAR